MFELRGSIDIGRPVEDVFAYLTDVKNNLDWESGVVESELTSDGPIGVGSKGRRVEKFFGTEKSTWEVTEYDANKRAAVRFDSDRAVGDGSFELEATENATRMEFMIRADAKGFFTKLLMPIISPMAERRANRSYGTLKRVLESKG